jgi:capsular polysaccharide biosynthesis protein
MKLRDYLRRHWIGIVLMTWIGISAGYGWALLQTPVYTAEATGYVATRQSAEIDASSVGDKLARSRVQSYVAIAGWRSVAENAIDDLGLDTTPEMLVTRVSVTNPQNTVIMKISAKADTPEAARDLAEAWLRAMIVEVDSIDGDGTQGSAPVTVLAGDSPSLPTTPSFPDIQTAVLVGGILGLGFGMAFVYASVRRGRPLGR